MFKSVYLRRLVVYLLLLSSTSTTYLYLYPVFHGCAFPSPHGSHGRAFLDTLKQHLDQGSKSKISVAPFRLLALGDPQLEGDTSIPRESGSCLPSVDKLWKEISSAKSVREILLVPVRLFRDLVLLDLPRLLSAARKRLDLLGNDFYLAHIYRTLHWWTGPTHVSVLGDLLGSQWIGDDEFERRSQRFWNRVFRGRRRLDDNVTASSDESILGQDSLWQTGTINVVGNHDVGYAGDLTASRMERFEHAFGKANWQTTFVLPENDRNVTGRTADDNKPQLRIVVLNSMNLDTPAINASLQQATYDFLNNVIVSSRPVEESTAATILLTHIPLHKDEGICVDPPLITYYDSLSGGGVREQNHLSYDAGKGILEGIFGMSNNPDAPGHGLGRSGIILTGHDHEGCDVYHHIPTAKDPEDGGEPQSRVWNALPWNSAGSVQAKVKTVPGIREITVRSMMGEFGGNAGLLSAWYDEEAREWRFEYGSCSLRVQHIWWTIHVVDLITLLVAVLAVLESGRRPKQETPTSDQPVSKEPLSVELVGSHISGTSGHDINGSSQGGAGNRRPVKNHRQHRSYTSGH